MGTIMFTFLLCFASQMLVYYVMPPTVAALSLSSETDKLALLALKEKLTNGVSDSLPSWNDSLHFCEWQGVTCGRRHMRVSSLHLENQTLGGSLGPSLGNLTFLKLLMLRNLALHGEIPAQIGRLKRLQDLVIDINKLEGEIPIELSNCTNLQVIELYHNHLTGRVPSWFGSMQLIWLNLGFNNLVGTIPPSLGNISSLGDMSLSSNHLAGNIPHALGKLSRLKTLNLDINNLTGEIPGSLYNLSNLHSLVLVENKLSGSLPSNINLAFPNLEEFLVGGNQMSGIFPSSISNITDLNTFDIGRNAFNGPIPLTLGQLNKLETIDIGDNKFGSGGAHDLDFLSSLTNCTELSLLSFYKNRLGGQLPDLIGNFSNLVTLDISFNQIYGAIPERIGELISLTSLDFGFNHFKGTIPSSIGMLKNMERLVLQSNKLSGNIPLSIGNLTILSEIYLASNNLEGSIPVTLRYCTKLEYVIMSINNLSGNIPNQTFVYLKGLTILSLSNNSFTGPIPSELGNLEQLSQLFLYSNKLSGEIPNQLGGCLSLTILRLRKNFFHGNIPSFLGSSIRSLDMLDLSRNNFSGTIPFELENLTLLNYLDLSFNNLYGEVPTGGVFSNASKISLSGNNNLCGGIPQLKLPACSRAPSRKHKRSLKKKLIIISVLGGILISFVAFLAVYFLTGKRKRLPSSLSLQNGKLRVTYGDLHEATNGFSSSNLVGVGSFGSVYRGSLLNFEGPIAVKVLNLETRGAAKSFIAECKALGKMKHRNLVKILTCCSSIDYNGEDFKAIVLDFMPNGCLEKLLHNNEGSENENHSLSFTQMVDIALDVAHALDYLHHDEEQVVVHCDVKPSNVLLDQDMVAHLGDFGLARLIHGSTGHSSKDQVNSSTIKGTIGYLPPEYGAGGPVSIEGDIYSYGILLLEMLTGKRPTDNMFYENLNLHKWCTMKISETILDIVDSRLLMSFTEDQIWMVENNIKECLVMFAKIGVACSEEFPTQRMISKDVIVKLLEIKRNISTVIKK